MEKRKRREVKEEIEVKILQNAMITPDGRILNSTHVHDYKGVQDENGYFYSVDGGLSYIKRSYPIHKLSLWKEFLRFIGKYKNPLDPIDLSIYNFTPFEEVREKLLRGSKGEYGNEDFHWVILKDMGTKWVKAAIKYNKKYHKDNSWISDMYREELKFRGNK